MATPVSGTGKKRVFAFDPQTVRDLFGSLDAEQESIEKFEEYFVTNGFYEAFSAEFPLRIAVGNKGSGKSAMLRAHRIERLQSDEIIPVIMDASDLYNRTDSVSDNMLKAVSEWKNVFAREAMAHLVTSSASDITDNRISEHLRSLPEFLSYASKYISRKSQGASDIFVRNNVNLSKVKSIVFYLDDLDRGWDGSPKALHYINSMLNACFDISRREKNIKFKIAIRWDMWDMLSRNNSDIDKIRENTIFLRWSIHDIYVVIANRIAKYFNIQFDYRKFLNSDASQEEIARIYNAVIVPRFDGYGKWENAPTRHVLLSMVRSRPRDLITLLTMAASEAHVKSNNIISSTNLNDIFPRYSEDRLNDLGVEFRTRLHGLEHLLTSFKPAKSTGKATEHFRYTNDKLITHIKDTLRIHGARIRFSDERGTPDFRRIIDFLYRIDFLQAWYKQSDGTIERINFQERQTVVSDAVDFGYSWEVLPAYRWAIQPTKIQDVLASLD
ncbi:hypothetical protein GCM10017083_09300 [Thalassobaculum fulvum]|uniref:Uncharacterized protein n=1 Tax=Thalassobaculum fulvum TaxID=1633335 RepID=A0A918XQE3_9PROT|nr:hypothetical protein [Thalassobaculum fulvum]GHD43321.1 hypothetical protein GCM10017083_09300 [Thalassobaculum fulvum]